MSGYSGTPLAKKLGIKPGMHLRLVDEPGHYLQLFTDFPDGVEQNAGAPYDIIHVFIKDQATLIKQLPVLKKQMVANGMIWVSWPKKASGVYTDVTEDLIRNCALQTGLVDIKVCAVDDTWSGLKLVIPVKDRSRI